MSDRVILTRQGYEKLLEELNYLKTKKRREVADQLAHARAFGDLRENAEYETAKETKQQLEIRINELETKLSEAQVVDASELPSDRAYLGTTVEVKNLGTGDGAAYTLVPQDETDFEKGKISITSPIGKGLLGKGLNDTVEIQIPAGKLKLQILKISRL